MKNWKNLLLTCLLLLSLACSLAITRGNHQVLAAEKKLTYVDQFEEFLSGFNPGTANRNDWAEYYNWLVTTRILYGGIGISTPYYPSKDGSYYYDVAKHAFFPTKSNSGLSNTNSANFPWVWWTGVYPGYVIPTYVDSNYVVVPQAAVPVITAPQAQKLVYLLSPDGELVEVCSESPCAYELITILK